MPKINPSVLKDLRERLKVSQTALAKQSKIDKQTIWRLEKGSQSNANRNTITRLCDTFSKGLNTKVTAEVLSGDAPLPTSKPPPDAWSEHKSQLNLRIDGAARNAFDLVALRYKVRVSQIMEIAPLLFLSAAGESTAAAGPNRCT